MDALKSRQSPVFRTDPVHAVGGYLSGRVGVSDKRVFTVNKADKSSGLTVWLKADLVLTLPLSFLAVGSVRPLWLLFCEFPLRGSNIEKQLE